MKKIVLAVLLVFVIPAFAGASDAARIGCIDFQKVLNESDMGKQSKADLEMLIKSKQIAIDEKGRTIEKMRSEIEKQVSVLSAEAKKSKEEEHEKLVREYQRLVQDAQAEVKKKEMELTDTIIREVRELVEKFGEEGSFTVIIEKGMAIYSSKTIDLTDSVLKKYNETKDKTKK
jgi:outer membrane protein